MNSNKIHDRIYYSYKRRKYIIVLLKYCINFQQIDLILCHPHHTKKSNSIYRNSKRFVVVLLFNPYIKKMENYWILWKCHKCVFLILTWIVDPITNLLVKLTIIWEERVCIYGTSRVFYKYSGKIGPKAKMKFYLSFFSIIKFNN